MLEPFGASPSFEVAALVRRSYESPDVDYKAAGNWRTWPGEAKAELVRDIMAMGNSDRPGWIVFGISQSQDGAWSRDGVSDADAKSFDPSDIGGMVKRYSDPEASFAVMTASVDDLVYVAVRVSPFVALPHICKTSYGDVLHEGAVYVRTDACQTSKITTAEQMRRIIDRGIQIHADSIVRRIEHLYGVARGELASSETAAQEFRSVVEAARRRLTN